jgi:hypothetical protein
MNKMTWLDLYQYLHSQANDISNIGKLDWNSSVLVHDAETGDGYFCDTYFIDNQLTLAFNMETIFEENKKGNS